MKIYVGYVLGDYAHALCMGFNEKKVQETLDSYPTQRPKWVDEYNIEEDKVVELDCD